MSYVIPTITPTEHDYAYLAGIVDGEGTIGMSMTSKKWRTIIMSLSIANTHLGMLHWIQERFGGYINGPRLIPNRKPGYRIRWDLGRAEQIIRSIYPWLIIKKAQADLALEYMEHRRLPGRAGRNGRPESTVLADIGFKEKMHGLNHVGTA